MKVGTREADGFARAPHKSCVLVYGPDQGLVRERSRTMAASVLGANVADPFRSAEMSGAGINGDPAALIDEAAALSLVGGRRVVRVVGTTDGAADAVATVLKARTGRDAAGEALLILEAGELGPRSALRRLFEDSADAAAVACYPDENERLSEFSRDALRELGHPVDAAALDWITAAAGGDRSVLRRELEKLSVYVGPGRPITAQDAEACLGDTALLGVDEVALAASTGDLAGLDQAVVRAYAAGQSPVTLLRAIGRELVRLHPASAAIAGGTSVADAMGQMRPPVFFKHKPAYQRALAAWRPDDLARAIEVVVEAEVACKLRSGADEAVAWRAALRVANAARRPAAADRR